MSLRVGFLLSHPIQYYTPIFRALAELCDLTVFYAHRQTPQQQSLAGFGVDFAWDVDLLSGYRSKFLKNVARKPSTDRFLGCDTPVVADEIASGHFDAFTVPGWALRCYLQAVWACRRQRIPVFVRGDSQLGSQRRLAAMRFGKAVAFSWLLRRFDGFFYVGQRNREYLQYYGVGAERLFFSPHCVDNDAFSEGSDIARRTQMSGSAEVARNRRILFVGKLVERKRPMDVLKAAALVRRANPDVEVAFAGSGELESQLREAATSLGVPTIFHGFVNQSKLPAVYAAASVMALPSGGEETWGLVVNEAMACGVPAIVSDAVGCGPDLVEPGVTGEVFALGDVASFAGAVQRALLFNTTTTRSALAKRMAVYSPQRAAQGIIEGAARFATPAR